METEHRGAHSSEVRLPHSRVDDHSYTQAVVEHVLDDCLVFTDDPEATLGDQERIRREGELSEASQLHDTTVEAESVSFQRDQCCNDSSEDGDTKCFTANEGDVIKETLHVENAFQTTHTHSPEDCSSNVKLEDGDRSAKCSEQLT